MRAIRDPDHVIFTLVNAKGGAAATLTCLQLHKRAERVSNLLNERAKINTGDHVALIFPPGIDLVCAFYGCLYVGEYFIYNPMTTQLRFFFWRKSLATDDHFNN